jgi:hypothetical protein
MHRAYAESLEEFGTPRFLPRSRGWLLERPIPASACRDAMGCYPLFACADWSQLHADLEELQNRLVSLALVTDPFGAYDPAYLRRWFRDVVRPFKEHYVVDLGRPMDAFVHAHHRRYARKALRSVSVERCPDPAGLLDEWQGLYANLIERHAIKGIPAFSRSCFARQLQAPGIVAFRALHGQTTVGMTLWYLQGEAGYYHLGAYSNLGYQLHASFALFWSAFEHFARAGLRWLNLGAGAGVESGGADGLSRFKQGWSTGTRTAYFCGRIFDRAAYTRIVQASGVPATDYFPAYREGEFGGNERHQPEGA